ncbi:hypothetical protein [Deinococcus cellulosilyticus]|uniref:Uncharacterized protein n=1 Tax=Deinococcus cellulosilyticus (strain DSM 18568 / NBRC 106333 / KACC 11606 / 5516J-15) TaxID=1223518 RepID=A0A511N9J0_DEIC1|nr:hypothetical protein [Deinococcus cellulosilyticus]GEM49186.1 hypothetical protein DC3_48210 [Deinococcus cellulosilyticus NBRC 106333 = KACC 11606]
MSMQRYGNYDSAPKQYPVSAYIWGHRFRIGQDPMEYLLEFLNVLYGFDYELGRGICDGEKQDRKSLGFKKATRLGLRRFVFYSDTEKSRHPRDDFARKRLENKLRQSDLIRLNPTPLGMDSGFDPVESAKSLLKSFTAVESNRSWFARALFPAHESLLFWEALRKKSKTERISEDELHQIEDHELDRGMEFTAANFFVRGGQLYYLLLSAGTRQDPQLACSITSRLKFLMKDSQPSIGQLAQFIDSLWQNESPSEELEEEDPEEGGKGRGYLGWIPEPDQAFCHQMAEDVNKLLHAELDATELLTLFSYLMAFQITQYIYHRSLVLSGKTEMLPRLLVDLLENSRDSSLRRASAVQFREQESQIRVAVQCHFEQELRTLFPGGTSWMENLRKFIDHLGDHYPVKKQDLSNHQTDLEARWSKMTGDKGIEAQRKLFQDRLEELLMGDFNKNFEGVHRKLAKYCGFVAPLVGTPQRYVLQNNLLKTLVYANLGPAERMEFTEFLSLLYQKYGLVVGLSQARESGLFERHRLNAEYYEMNQNMLLQKLKNAGLALEFSDATAMVQGGQA